MWVVCPVINNKLTDNEEEMIWRYIETWKEMMYSFPFKWLYVYIAFNFKNLNSVTIYPLMFFKDFPSQKELRKELKSIKFYHQLPYYKRLFISFSDIFKK